MEGQSGAGWGGGAKHLKRLRFPPSWRALLVVHGGVGVFHFGSCFVSSTDLNQWADSDSGTALGGCLPLGPAFQQFGPEWKEPALGGLGRVEAATVFRKEMALFSPGFAEAEQVAGAVDEAALEVGRLHT